MTAVPRAEVERVCQVVTRWIRRVYAGSADLDDLCQEGCMGALEALSTFDPDKGAQFITYAFRGAQLKVWRAMEKNIVWHTTSTHQQVRDYRRGEHQLSFNSSLDASRGEDGSSSLHEIVPDDTAPPEPELWDDDALQALDGSLRLLGESLSTQRLRDAAAELRRDPTASVRDIGERVGLSHARVHHVKNRAIQMTRDRVGVDRWVPRRRMVAMPKKG